MKMKKTIMMMLFSVFLLSALAVPTLSQTDVGVQVDDHFMWVGTYTQVTTDPTLQTPGQLAIYATWNDTDHVNRTVTAISGVNVTFDTVWVYKNGTEDTSTEVIPIINSTAGSTIQNYVIIGANMEPGDNFTYNDQYGGTLSIDETVQIDYGEGPRDTNYHFTTTTAWATVGREYWFDKATGIISKAKINATRVEDTRNSTTTYTLELKDTNRWIIPEFPTGTVMLLAFAAVAVSVEIIRRKKLKK
jgi:uncharacterized protein (UPF0333 family)